MPNRKKAAKRATAPTPAKQATRAAPMPAEPPIIAATLNGQPVAQAIAADPDAGWVDVLVRRRGQTLPARGGEFRAHSYTGDDGKAVRHPTFQVARYTGTVALGHPEPAG